MSWRIAYRAACTADKRTPRPEIDQDGEVTCLNLQGNVPERFTNRIDSAELVTLCRALSAASSITELNLEYNRITDEGAIALGDVLRRNSTIQHVSLAHNDITHVGAKALADALMINMTVVTMILRGNAIGDEGGMALSTMLRGNNTLVLLDIGQCGLATTSLVSLSLALMTHPTLCALRLDKPLLKGPHELSCVVQHLTAMLMRNTVLTEVSMNYFGLGDDHLLLMLPALVQNDSIKVLSLCGNKFSCDGGVLLAKLLSRRPDLISLNVAGNRVDDVGAAALATAVQSHPSLRFLDLARNAIGDRGLEALADGLAVSIPLQQFFVWGNHFGQRSAAAFHRHGKRVKQLDMIDISTYVVDGVAMVAQHTAA